MSSPPRPPPRIRNRWVWPLCIASLALIPFLVPVGGYLVFRAANARAVHRLEAKAREKGEPITLAELAAKLPAIPAENNAAFGLIDLWEKEQPKFWQAFRRGDRSLPKRTDPAFDPALPFLGSDSSRRVFRTEPLPPESLRAAETFLQEQSNHLNAVRRALNRPYCRFTVKIRDGYAALLPHLLAVKTEAQKFRIAGIVALEHSDANSALAALDETARTGQTMAEDPFLISQLVRLSCFTMVVEDAQRLLSRQSLSIAQLDRLQGLLERVRMKGTLSAALIGERAAALAVFDSPAQALARIGSTPGEAQDPAEARNLQIVTRFMKAAGVATVDRRLTPETMEQAIAFAAEEPPAGWEDYERLFGRVNAAAHSFPPKMISMMLLPALSGAQKRFTVLEARRRAGLAALAVERFRLSHGGQLPNNLKQLVPGLLPAVPLDPFDGLDLRFDHRPTGYVIYSVGSDRQDDGGKERPRNIPAGNYDETFIVER